MRRFLFSLLSVSFFLPALSVAHAATLTPGDLIKASGPSVYYYGADNKRYVFPTEKTYFTWYAGFDGVRTISDAELGAITIGGNVTHRPGVKLVKITTDPKVYAVDANGTLRWVQSETLAITLFGTQWNKMVDDIPDAFFVNYRLGQPLVSASDYVPGAVRDAASSINVDKRLGVSPAPTPAPTPTPTPSPTPTPTPTPAPTPTYTGTLTSSKSNVKANELLSLLGLALPSSGVSSIKLFFDGQLVRSCEYSPCGTDVRIPSSGTKNAYEPYAEIRWITGQTFTARTSINVEPGISGLTLGITHPEVMPNGTREIVVDVDNSFSARLIDIYIDGVLVRGCNSVQQCRFTDAEPGTLGTVHSVHTVLTDANGFTRQSESKTISVVANPKPEVSVTLGKTSIYVGETVDVTVSAMDADGVTWTEVWVDGSMVRRCAATSCTTVIGPWTSARSITVTGRAQDGRDLVGDGANPASLEVR